MNEHEMLALSQQMDGDFVAIARQLEESYIGDTGGTLIGGAAAIALLEALSIKFREVLANPVRPVDEEALLATEDAIATFRGDLLSRVVMLKVNPTA